MAHITVFPGNGLVSGHNEGLLLGPPWESRGGPCPDSENHCVGLAGHPSTAKSEGASLPPPFQLSGLFQSDDSYETCSSKSVPGAGESIRGGKEGDEKNT